MTIAKEERARWENIWKILRSLDQSEVEAAEPGPYFNWDHFSASPHRYLLQTDDRQNRAIWEAVEKRMPKGSSSNGDQSAREREDLSRTKVGVTVYCRTCGLPKKPLGRDSAAVIARCDYECPGYWNDPRAGSLWPGESEHTFGYPVGDAGTEERQTGGAS